MGRRGFRTRTLTLAALFGVVVFSSKIFLPTPIDKAFILVQALFLALGFLLMGPLGATYVAAIGGLLTAFWRAPLAPFTLSFALIYGLLVDGSCTAFRVRAGDLKTGRLVASMTLSTAAVGLVTYYLTVHVFALLPENPIMYIGIIVAGVLNGVAGGYLAALVWKRALRYVAEVRS